MIHALSVDTAYVHQVWDGIQEFLEASIAYNGGDFSLEQVKALLSLGHWQLIVFQDDDGVFRGAATIDYTNRPEQRVGFVTTIGGKDIINSDDTYQEFVGILKSNGATMLEGACRPSMARLLKQHLRAEERFTVVGVEL